jgi:hypothetical protein
VFLFFLRKTKFFFRSPKTQPPDDAKQSVNFILSHRTECYESFIYLLCLYFFPFFLHRTRKKKLSHIVCDENSLLLVPFHRNEIMSCFFRTVPSIITFSLERWCQRRFILISYLLEHFFFFSFSFLAVFPLEMNFWWTREREEEKFMTLQICFQQSSWYYTIHSSFYLHNAIFHDFFFLSPFFTTTDSDDW